MLVHDELVLQHQERLKCSEELTTAHKLLVVQHNEKDIKTIELSFANDSLAKFQRQQKEHTNNQ
jgi:hypothetical protein